MDIRGTVSNHRDLDQSAATYGIAPHHIPVTAQTEARLLEIAAAEKIELVLPARCMQVLSDAACRQLDGCASTSTPRSCAASRASNPAFDRGVKIIGATAHCVTAALDEGPIIERDVARVDHSHDAAQFTAIGRDLECAVLARAVKRHADRRVLIDRNRTVVSVTSPPADEFAELVDGTRP